MRLEEIVKFKKDYVDEFDVLLEKTADTDAYLPCEAPYVHSLVKGEKTNTSLEVCKNREKHISNNCSRYFSSEFDMECPVPMGADLINRFKLCEEGFKELKQKKEDRRNATVYDSDITEHVERLEWGYTTALYFQNYEDDGSISKVAILRNVLNRWLDAIKFSDSCIKLGNRKSAIFLVPKYEFEMKTAN